MATIVLTGALAIIAPAHAGATTSQEAAPMRLSANWAGPYNTLLSCNLDKKNYPSAYTSCKKFSDNKYWFAYA